MSQDVRRPRFHIGADENGLGPLLGPMIVTAVLARLDADGHATVSRPPSGALATRLGDSKLLVAHGDIALGEAWARALALAGLGRRPFADESPAALLDALSLDDSATLRARCPSHVEAQCWQTAGEAFLADSALVGSVAGDLGTLKNMGVSIVGVRSMILCTRAVNGGLGQGKNRLVLDLHAMERLALALREIAGEETTVVCGKVGGLARYGDAFGPIGALPFRVIEEGRARSVYSVPGAFEIAFVRDADASDLCVGMASLVGKYVREALMARVVRFYRETDPSLPDASGYYDRVTKELVDRTRRLRVASAIPDECFLRARTGTGPGRS